MRLKFNRSIKLILIAALLYGLSFSVWDLFFNLYILSLGFSNDMLGLIRFATPLAALILGLPLGLLSDRIGSKRSMLIGLSIGLIGMFFQIHLLSPILIFFFALVQGAGFMLFSVSQPPFIMANSKTENQAIIFSLNFGLIILSTMIGNLIAGSASNWLEKAFQIPQGSSLSYQWVITAGIALAATSLIPLLLITESKNKTNKTRTPIVNIIRRLAKNPLVRRFALINLITGFGAALLIPYLNVFLRTKFNINDDLLGIIFSLSSLVVFIGSIASSWLVKLTNSRIIPTVVTQGISIVFLFILGFSPFLWVVSISMLLRSVFMQMSAPLIDNFAMLVSEPGEQASIASIRGIGWQLGQALGILISGLVQTRYGFSPLFVTTGLLYIFAIILTWVYFRPEEKELYHAGRA
jgi:MFS family permease